MVSPALLKLAQSLYEANEYKSVPKWNQLGSVTVSVWVEKAERKLAGDPEWYSCFTKAERALRNLQSVFKGTRTMSLNNKLLAEQFDQLSELVLAIAGTFRDGGGEEAGGGVNGKAAKPVRSAGKSATPGKAKPKASEEITLDDLRDVTKALIDAKGKDKLVEALDAFGASKLSEVEESDYEAFKDKVDELMVEDDVVGDAPKSRAKPAAKKTTSKAKPKAPDLEEDIQPKFAELVEADRPAAVALLKKYKAKKLSELDEDSYTDFLEAVEEALAAGGEDDLTS